MRSPFLTIFLLLLHLTASSSYALIADPPLASLQARHPQNSLPISRPLGAPPKPWNQHICVDVSEPVEVHLTFSWGAKLSPRSLTTLFSSAKKVIHDILVSGRGELPIASSENFIIARSDGTGVFLVARAVRKLFRSTESFTFDQVAEAVRLLYMCGLEEGRFEEMWANVYDGRRQIGVIYIGHPISAMLGMPANTTIELSGS